MKGASSADQTTDRSCYEANIFGQRPDRSYGTGAVGFRKVHIKPI